MKVLCPPWSAHIWRHCTAMPEFTRNLKKEKAKTQDQLDGIEAHEVLQKAMEDKLDLPPEFNELSPVINYLTNAADLFGSTIKYELSHDASAAFGFPAGTMGPGFIDILLDTPGVSFEIADLKWGVGTHVSEIDNWQLLIPAIGLSGDAPRGTSVTTTIFQPRGLQGKRIRSVTYSTEDLEKKWLIIKDKVKQVLHAPKFVVGGHCRQCPGNTQCKAYAQEVTEDLDKLVDLTDAPKEALEDTFDNDTLSKWLHRAPILLNAIKIVETLAYDRAMEGQKIPDYKLVERRGSRTWINADELQARAAKWRVNRKALGLDTVAPRKFLSPTQLEKIPGLTKAHKETITKHISRKPGKPQLVLENDPRPEMPPVDSFFDAIETENTEDRKK